MIKIALSLAKDHEVFDLHIKEKISDETIPSAGPVDLVLTVTRSKQEVVVRGNFTIKLHAECSRCLEKFAYTLSSPFDSNYQVEVNMEKPEIDISEDMRQSLILALPVKPLCTEYCRGLCAQCRTNLNKNSCSCKTDIQDDRMATLKKYKFNKN
ncbi:MAG: DUF177 domain-containing protein [bacterium]